MLVADDFADLLQFFRHKFGISSLQTAFASFHHACKISEKGVLQICGEKIAIDQQTSLHAIASCLYNESKKQTRAIPAIESAAANAQKKINLLKGTSTLQKEATHTRISEKRAG